MTANTVGRVPRALVIILLVCVATSAAWFRLQTPTAGIDDANIFLVYAQNLSGGKGFVFNAGGDRVEGFTSFVWLLICAAAYRLTGSPEPLLLVINVLLVTLTISCCLTTSTLRRSSHAAALSVPWASLFLALLLCDFDYVAWSTITLMETALWTALLTMSAMLVLDDAVDRIHVYGFAAVMAILVATRPEALVWGPLMVFLFYVSRRSVRGHQVAFRCAVPGMIACTVAAGLMTAGRLWYFGYPLPNTYYAKISPSLTYRLTEGADYLWVYLSSGLVPPACALAAVVSILHVVKKRPPGARTVALSAMTAAGLMLPVYMGGDHFAGFRFFQPVYPIFLLTLVNALRFVVPEYFLPASGRAAKGALVVASLILTGLFLVSKIADWRDRDHRTALHREFNIAELGRDRGRHAEILFAELQQRPSIAAITVGGLKYTYSGEVIDLMGLNNTRMAHNNGTRVGIRSHAAFEKHTFYQLNPRLVLPLVQYSDLAVQATRIWFVDIALKGLIDDKPFRDKYRLAEVRRTTPDGVVSVAGWYDRDFLSQLEERKVFRITASPPTPD
jgi:arabinofuranosyltransferase